MDDTLEFQDTIVAFPTSNLPVMDSVIKEMFISLWSAIHTDMLQLMSQCNSAVQVVDERVAHVEQ